MTPRWGDASLNPRLAEQYPPITLGETAENPAEKYEVSRSEQDEYALSSHQKALAALDTGRFAEEIVPAPVSSRDGRVELVRSGEGPRRDTSLEKLGALKPVFREGGTVTAGNSSPLADGAAAVLLMSEEKAIAIGYQPMARVVDMAVAGVHPNYMGIGPVPATEKVLGRLRLTLKEMDVIELNEAFAAQVLAVLREWNLEPADPRLNPNGGAIALGHPLGCSGARIVVTLVHELHRRGGRYGLATMCIGVGQGIATVLEKV